MQDDPRMKGEGDLFDNYEYAHSNSKNFYQRYMQGEDVKAAWVNASDFQTETYQTE